MTSVNDESSVSEVLEFLEQQLEENKNFKTINKYGGKGGFGLVLFVEDKENPLKKYAIKAQSTINVTIGKINEQLLQQCKEEAEVMRNCKHKNVVEIHSDFEIGFYHFIQMNLCKCSLDDWIAKNHKPINDMIFLHYVNQIIDGLEYLHSKGYVLRDLSTRNILLTTDGVIKLCDFGLAKKYDSAFRSKALYSQNAKGVFIYFPPELIEDLQNDHEQVKQTKEGDVWALGICLSLLGGAKISDFFHVQNPQFQIPDSKYLSNKANQLVKYILNRNPTQRPNIQQIREKIYTLFLESFQEFSINQKIEPKIKSSDNEQQQLQLSQNSDQQTNISHSSTSLLSSSQQIQSSYLLNSNNYIERMIDFNFKQKDIIYKKYQKFVEENPNNQNTLITLGFIEVKSQSNFENSKKCFEKCLGIDDNEIDAYLGICFCIIKNFEFKNFNQALDYLEICLNKRKDYWRIYYMKSWLLLTNQKYQESLECLEKGLKLNKDSIQLLSLKIALHAFYSLDYQEVQNASNKVIELNKENDPIIFYRIALFYSKIQNDKLKAIYYCRKALEYDQKDLQTLIYLSDLYFQNGDQKNSQDFLNKIEILYPQNSNFLYFLGRIENDKDKKIKLFEESLKSDALNKQVYHDIVKILLEKNMFDESIKQYENILEIDIDDQEASCQIGLILAEKKNDYHKAIQFFQNLIQNNKKNTRFFIILSDLYEKIQDHQSSKLFFNQCLQTNPNCIYSYFVLSQIECINNNFDKENQYLRKCLEINTGDEELLLLQGYIAKKIDKKDNSKTYLKKLRELNPNVEYINFYLGQVESDIQKQLEYYQLQLNLTPQSQIVLYNIGMNYKQQENYNLALEFFEKAFNHNPNDFIDWDYKITQIIFSNELKIFKESDILFNINFAHQKLVEINPEIANQFSQLADIYQQSNKYKLAIENIEKHIKFYPNDEESCIKAGDIASQNKNYEKALKAYQKAVEINPNNSLGLRNLGIAYEKIGIYKEACQYMLKAIQIDPSMQLGLEENLSRIEKIDLTDKYEVMIQLSDWYKEIKQLDKAKKIRENLINANPQDESNYYVLGCIEYSLKYYNESTEQFQKYLKLNPNNGVNPKDEKYYYALGCIEYSLKNYNKSIEQFQKYLKLNPNNANVNLQIGKNYLKLQKFQKALEFLFISLQLEPNNFETYYEIGFTYGKRSEHKKGIEFLQKAIQLNSEDAQTYYILGESYQILSNFYLARQSYIKALTINPNFQGADQCKTRVQFLSNYISQEKCICNIF